MISKKNKHDYWDGCWEILEDDYFHRFSGYAFVGYDGCLLTRVFGKWHRLYGAVDTASTAFWVNDKELDEFKKFEVL